MSAERGAASIDRERFERLADAILPAFGTMPAASAVGVAGPLLDRALAALPPVGPVLREILARPTGDVPAFLEELRAARPSQFATLVLVTAATYYLSAEVREKLGYDGQEALRIDVAELPGYLEDGTLDRVIARGPLYRDPDAEVASRLEPSV